MKKKFEKWLDSLIAAHSELEKIGDFAITEDKSVGQFECYHTGKVNGVIYEHTLQITDAKLAGEMLGIPVHWYDRGSDEYPLEYYFQYKDWIIFSISKQ